MPNQAHTGNERKHITLIPTACRVRIGLGSQDLLFVLSDKLNSET